MKRVRIYYSKTWALRYTGNLDVHKVWERTIRRAHLPVAYTQGFHPQPRLNQACPLPLGMTSLDEILDIWITQDIEKEEVMSKLVTASPPGIEISRVEDIELINPALQTQVKSSEYQALLLATYSKNDLDARVKELLSSESLPRQRRDKPYDLRPLIEELDAGIIDGMISLRMLLSAREGATGRPEEVLLALGIDPLDTRIERVKLVI